MRKLLFGVILIDQLAKQAVEHFMMPGESIPIIAGVFHLTFVLNPGAAFGILENQQWFFIVVALVLIVGASAFYYKVAREGPFFRYGCMALVGGAAGNLIDRLTVGTVVDFFDFRVWPVFNIADIAIVLGMASMVYDIMFSRSGSDASDSGNGRRGQTA